MGTHSGCMVPRARHPGGALRRHAARAFGDTQGKDVLCLCGFVLLRQAPLQMYLFGTANGHNGPQANFKDYEVVANCVVLLIVLCVWEVVGVYTIVVAKAVALLRGRLGTG